MESFEILEQIHNFRGRTDRFSYAKVRKGDQVFFYKKSNGDEPTESIAHEKAWGDFMEMVERAYPDAHLRGPHDTQLVGDDGILMELIEAPHLADHHDLRSWRDNIERYASMLYILDAAAEGWSTGDIIRSEQRSEKAFEIWDKWLGDNKPRVKQLDEAKTVVNNYRSAITTRMQHGDLAPWQIFNDDPTWIIYDGERCGTDLPRYNDLAYGYGRLFTMLHSPETAAALLRRFIEIAGIDKDGFTPQFLPVMMGRAIGMLSDAFRDQPDNDYIHEANRLVDLCLTRKLDSLLDF